MDYTDISSRIYQNKYGQISVTYKGNTRVHDPIKDNDLSYLPQEDQDTVNMLFDSFGREEFATKQTERDAQDLIDNPILPPPTQTEIYNQTLTNFKLIKNLVKALNDGSFVPGSNYTNDQMKDIILSKGTL